MGEAAYKLIRAERLQDGATQLQIRLPDGRLTNVHVPALGQTPATVQELGAAIQRRLDAFAGVGE